MQFLVKKSLREPIISGDNKKFIEAYKKGDISKKNLFHVVCQGSYPCEKSDENELLLLLIDGKRQGNQGKYSFFATKLFVPTPIFTRKSLEDKDIIYFHPCRMTWSITGNVLPEERDNKLQKLSELLGS